MPQQHLLSQENSLATMNCKAHYPTLHPREVSRMVAPGTGSQVIDDLDFYLGSTSHVTSLVCLSFLRHSMGVIVPTS